MLDKSSMDLSLLLFSPSVVRRQNTKYIILDGGRFLDSLFFGNRLAHGRVTHIEEESDRDVCEYAVMLRECQVDWVTGDEAVKGTGEKFGFKIIEFDREKTA